MEGIVLTAQTRSQCCCYWLVCLFVPLLVLVSGCGGEPEVESTPERSAVEQGIVCDRFELRWELDGTDLLLAIDTDLPDKGELSVSVRRTYYEVGSDDAYSRDYFSEFELVSLWREPRRIALDADAWKADLTAHQNQMAAIGDDLAFEIARIEDSIQIRAVLHTNQDDPRFGGRGNSNLSGEATSRIGNGGSVLVEAEAIVEFPLDGPPPSSRSSRAPYDGLVTGESYRLSRETPLMPERRASGSLDFLENTLSLPTGTIIRVEAVDRSGTELWYHAALVENEHMTGWINSIALIGQQIDRVE